MRLSTITLIIIVNVYAVLTASAQVLFEDVTDQAGPFHKGESWGVAWGDFNGDNCPDIAANNHRHKNSLWRNNCQGGFEDVMLTFDVDRIYVSDPIQDTHGMSFADFDNDGDQDIFATRSNNGSRGQFFINDGQFGNEQGSSYGFNSFLYGRLGSFFDYDNDGLLDMFGARSGSGRYVYKNNGVGNSFQRVESMLGIEGQCIRNGYTQFSNFYTASPGMEMVCAREGTFPNRLYDMSTVPFQNIDALFPPPPATPFLKTTGAVVDTVWADFDNDLDADLFALRSGLRPSGASRVSSRKIESWISTEQVQGPKGFSFSASGNMTVSITDIPHVNNPERLSRIFVGTSGYHPSTYPFTLDPSNTANQGISGNSAYGFYIGYDPTTQHWTVLLKPSGNESGYIVVEGANISEPTQLNLHDRDLPFTPRLHRKDSDGKFTETYPKGLFVPLNCGSIGHGDFDNDMDIDLYMICRQGVENTANRIFWNNGDGTWTEASSHGAEGPVGAGLENGFGSAESVAVADYDVDGFLDFFITNGNLLAPREQGGWDTLIHNTGNSNHWIELDLVGNGTTTNRDGIGSMIQVNAGGLTQMREQHGGYHRWSQDHQRIHVGLGSNTTASITVNWPDGSQDTYNNVAADALYKVNQSGSIDEAVVGPVALFPAPQPGDECGSQLFDASADKGIFLSKDCASGEWTLRATSGGHSVGVNYTGSIVSSQLIGNLSNFSFEGGDFATQPAAGEVNFSLAMSGPGVDGLGFKLTNGADSCLTLDAPADARLYIGAGYIPASSPLNLETLQPCESVPTTSCGEPIIDDASDRGFFLWQDCTGDDRWTVRATAGSGPTLTYAGTVSTDQNFNPVVPLSFESSDVLDSSTAGVIDFKMTMSSPWYDSFSFYVDPGSTCLSLDTPAGESILVGKNKAPVSSPFDIQTLESCASVLSISDANVSEGAGSVAVEVSLSSPSTQVVTVDYQTVNGSATSGLDYGLVSGSLTFAAGDSRETINIPILQDTNIEDVETFTVQLSAASNALITDSVAVVSIDDDEVSACGEPTIDDASDRGFFLWQDCTGDDRWTVWATAGSGSRLMYAGNLTAFSSFSEIAPRSIESSDVLDTGTTGVIDFELTISSPWYDSFSFQAGTGSTCLRLNVPAGQSVLVGENKVPVSMPFNIKTLGACNAAGNTTPVVVNPGDQIRTVGANVSLFMGATDADGDTLMYSASGLPLGLAIDSNTGEISGSANSAGASTVTVTVTDGIASVSASFSWTIVVLPNQAPRANAGMDRTTAINAVVILQGSASDDGLPNPPGAVTSTWDVVSGPGSVSFGDAGELETTAVFSAEGNYVLRLTVNDGALTDTDNVSISVGAKKYRYVRLMKSGSNTGGNYINLAEVQVIDGSGLNRALSGTASMSSTHSSPYPASQCNDGNTATATAMCHTGGSSPNDWWQVDLGGDYDISQIKIFNRDECCQDRLSNVYVLASDTAFANNTDLNAARANANFEYQIGGVSAGNPDRTVVLNNTAPAGLYYGTVAGDINTTAANPQTSVTSDLSETEDSIALNTTEIFSGYIFDADGNIAFSENIDDKTRLYVDGELVLSSDVWNDRVSTPNLQLTAGWHQFELRISNGGGPGGPQAGLGFGYDPNGGSNWIHPEDPGDGSLFRL